MCGYIRTFRPRLECQFAVSLRNVNLCSRPGGYQIRALHDDVGTTFLGDGGRGGQRCWPFATYVFCETKCINEC